MELFKKKRQRAKRAPKTLKQILSDAYLATLRKDPELMRRIAFIEAGHADLLTEKDPVEQKRKELKQVITEKALEAIQNDPDLADEFIHTEVENILNTQQNNGNGRRRRRKDEFEDIDIDINDPVSTLEKALEDLDNITALRERLEALGMGKEKAGFFSNMKPADIIQMLTLAKGFLGNNGNGNNVINQPMPPQRVFVVEVDGKPQELTEAQYARFKNIEQRKQLQTRPVEKSEDEAQPYASPDEPPIITTSENNTPYAMTGQPKPEQRDALKDQPKSEQFVPIIEDDLEQPNSDNFDLANIVEEIDVDALMEWFEMKPNEFVDELIDNIKQGNEDLKILYGFLTSIDYETLCGMVQPYSNDEKAAPVIEKILASREWFEEVFKLVREKEDAVRKLG